MKKRVSITLDDMTYSKILDKAISDMRPNILSGKQITKKAGQLILRTIMDAFPSDVVPCDHCGKVFSIEADEGSMRDTGTFCNKHLPIETEEI